MEREERQKEGQEYENDNLFHPPYLDDERSIHDRIDHVRMDVDTILYPERSVEAVEECGCGRSDEDDLIVHELRIVGIGIYVGE